MEVPIEKCDVLYHLKLTQANVLHYTTGYVIEKLFYTPIVLFRS